MHNQPLASRRHSVYPHLMARKYNVLANLDVEATLDEIATGILMPEIAARHNVHKSSLRNKLVQHPRYAETIKEQSMSIVENAMTEMMNCNEKDQAIIARAKVDSAFKYARSMHPEVFGDKVTVDHRIDLTLVLSDAQSRLSKLVHGEVIHAIEHDSDDIDSTE